MESEFDNSSFREMEKERLELFKSQDDENGLFDITFIIEGKILLAHKFIVGSISPIFKGIFLESLKNGNDDPIIIDNYTYQNFYDFLEFVYSGSCGLNDENIFALAEISVQYNVEVLQKRCNQYFSNAEYEPENFIEFFERLIEHPYFRRAFYNGLMEKYPKWLSSTNFWKAKKETILSIVRLERPFKHEAKLFEAVYGWAKTRGENIQKATSMDQVKPELNAIIKDELTDILPKIFFNAMEAEFVNNYVVQRGFLFSYPELSNIMNSIKKFQVEVTDFQGKIAYGTLFDQNFIVDEIKELQLDNVKSNGSSWILSKKFNFENLKFVDAETDHDESIYYLQIRRNSGKLCISHHLDDDIFLAKMAAQKGFKNSDCVIQIKI